METALLTAVITGITTLLTSAIGIIVSHLLYSRKLFKETKNAGYIDISNKILQALEDAREIELKLKTFEILDLKNELIERKEKVDFFGFELKYHEIFTNFDHLNSFKHEVIEFRKQNSKYLSKKLNINMSFLHDYIFQLTAYLSLKIPEHFVPTISILFYNDLNIWQKRVDRIIIKEINRHKYKLEPHSGFVYHYLNYFYKRRYYKQTFLY